MKSNTQSLYPTIYRGVLETDILSDVEDIQFNRYFGHMDAARRNQFVQTADVRGIEATEKLYRIRANPATEDLEFRRQRLLHRMRTAPPFTMRYLRERLDDLIGPDRYKAWLSTGEYSYRLGNWSLGREPFRDSPLTLHVEATNSSLQDAFFADHADYTVQDIDHVLLNDNLEITYFLEKEASGSVAVIRYVLPNGHDLTEITNIKLLKADGTVLSSAAVFIPVTAEMMLKHIINHGEVMVNATN